MKTNSPDIVGYFCEWNLECPGGWDYQRVTQNIGRVVWQKLNEIQKIPVELDFSHPLFFPINYLVEMLVEVHRSQNGRSSGRIAVVAEKETLSEVSENRNLAESLSKIPGITGVLMSPEELEIGQGQVCFKGQPISLIYLDIPLKGLLEMGDQCDLEPLWKADAEQRIVNPLGLGVLDNKGLFEALYSQQAYKTVPRIPWTKKFYARNTIGPSGEKINDLIAWTRKNWCHLVLKPAKGYSGQGIRVGCIHPNSDEAIELALKEEYIVQKKVPLVWWAEEMPVVNLETREISLEMRQIDFRSLIGPNGAMGFLCRYGGVPTNVGAGGGVMPLAVVRSEIDFKEAVNTINASILAIGDDLFEIEALKNQMAIDQGLTYLNGPIKIPLRPRIVTLEQLEVLKHFCVDVWDDCLQLSLQYQSGALSELIGSKESMKNVRPWNGSWAMLASDGLFGFGAA